MRPSKKAPRQRLPASLRPLFWDYDFKTLSWDQDRDLVISRILSSGGWDAITWLRAQLGNSDLGDWIVRRQGAGLSPRQLRFWELVLGLPRRQVNAWLADTGRVVWDRRVSP